MRRFLFLFALSVVLGLETACAQDVDSKVIDALVDDALRHWQVPGLAVAVVHNDRLAYIKGFGVRNLDKPDPITPDTIFPIASCTKTVTSLALAMLVDEGKLHWDDPVRKHVPFFRLADPLADANVTLRDLLTHRTGVGAHDLLWYKAPWDFEERIRKIGKVELDHSFRSSFEYQTILFGAAGYAGGKAAGSSWRALVEKRVFGRLDMKSASCVYPREAGDVADPHKKNAQGKAEAISRYPLDQPDPAGSVHASARDMSQFLRFQLGNGSWNGKRLLAERNLAETHMPQVVVRVDGFVKEANPETLQISYGLGWVVQDYRGKLMVVHGGAIDGFRAQLTLVPQAKLGIVLLNNLDGVSMNIALTNTLIDRVLGFPQKDWHTFYRDLVRRGEEEKQAAAKAFLAKRLPDRPSTLPLAAYAGKFVDAAYGPCEVAVQEGRLIWRWAAQVCPLEHYQDDTFLANNDTLNNVVVDFAVGNGRAEAVRLLGRVFQREK
ncbi:MAG: serine hydrolase [Planctomycetes bacterium]|nr:serine hydrolase [Planctomycetota bacterium]